MGGAYDMTTPDNLGNDTLENLTRDHLRADAAVFVVAWYLRRKGREGGKPIWTLIPPTITRNPGEDFREFSDAGDLFLAPWKTDGELPTSWARVEVSRRSENFTGIDDYPHDDLIVCGKHRIPENGPPPFEAYYLVSHDLGAYAMIPRDTRETWKLREIHDRRRPEPRTNYCADLQAAKWGQFPVEMFDELAEDLIRLCGLEGLT